MTSQKSGHSYISEAEKQFLDGCVETGSLLYLELFKSIISAHIHGGEEKEECTSLVARVTGNLVGLGVGIVSSPFAGSSIGEMVQKATTKCVQALVTEFQTQKRAKQNILSWTNTLGGSDDSGLAKTVSQGMAFICVAFKDQLASFPENDLNRFNFFLDVTRRIFNYLSEFPGHGKVLTAEIIYNAFIEGRSTPKKYFGTRFSKERGIEIGSSEFKWNTRAVFEECGLIESLGDCDYVLYSPKGVSKETMSKLDFRYKFKFETRVWEDHIMTDLLLDDLNLDWRLNDQNINHYIQNVSVAQSTKLKDIMRSLDSASSDIVYIREAIERIEKKQISSESSTHLENFIIAKETGNAKVDAIPLRNKWWPDKKILIKSLHKRKIGDSILVEEIYNKLTTDENRRVVIFQSVGAAKFSGLGGIGKTISAKWFAHHYEQEFEYIIWIDCGEGSLLSSFKSLARDLKVDYWTGISDVKELARKSFELLSEFKCLWIYDNAESYQDHEGIKEVLPKYENNFFCLITSRHREWGNKNGYGTASEIELDVFDCRESVEFLKANLSEDVAFTESQLIQLCELLGNLPLAIQLAVTTLNNEKMSLANYIQRTSLSDVSNIVNTKFDDYERTVNMNVNIILESIKKERLGNAAYGILLVFGYIIPDNVDSEFLRRVVGMNSTEFKICIRLLENYSLVSKTGIVAAKPVRRFLSQNSTSEESDLLSIHRLLQQVIRHIGRDSERITLQKILRCKGYLEYKLIPYCQFASEDLQKEFKKIRTKLVEQVQLSKLLEENRFSEAVELASVIDRSLNSHTTSFNYAVCLFKKENWEVATQVLENVLEKMSPEKPTKELSNNFCNYYLYVSGTDIMDLKLEPSTALVAGLLFLVHCKRNCYEEAQQILDQEKHLVIKYSLDSLHYISQCLNFIPAIYISSNTKVIYLDQINGDPSQSENILSPNSLRISQTEFEIVEGNAFRTGLLAVVKEGKINGDQIVAKFPQSKDGIKYVLNELKTLLYIGEHPNVLKLIGTSTTETRYGKLYTFFERCPFGNLQDILRATYHNEPEWYGGPSNSDVQIDIGLYHLYSWSYQIANALQFLSSKQVIHRLLMARNVLLFDNDVVKLTDFELSTQLKDHAYIELTNNTPLPWRYTAIECLQKFKFSTQSDVWSFGIVVWEIFSLGKRPYSGLLHIEELYEMFSGNQRLCRPKNATTDLYNFLMRCWSEIPDQRPSPQDCKDYFNRQKESNQNSHLSPPDERLTT